MGTERKRTRLRASSRVRRVNSDTTDETRTLHYIYVFVLFLESLFSDAARGRSSELAPTRGVRIGEDSPYRRSTDSRTSYGVINGGGIDPLAFSKRSRNYLRAPVIAREIGDVVNKIFIHVIVTRVCEKGRSHPSTPGSPLKISYDSSPFIYRESVHIRVKKQNNLKVNEKKKESLFSPSRFLSLSSLVYPVYGASARLFYEKLINKFELPIRLATDIKDKISMPRLTLTPQRSP